MFSHNYFYIIYILTYLNIWDKSLLASYLIFMLHAHNASMYPKRILSFRLFCGSYRRLRWHRLQVVVRVCCFLRFCIKPMRYIYHPQLDCYIVVVNSDCSRPCELTLSCSFWTLPFETNIGYFSLISNIQLGSAVNFTQLFYLSTWSDQSSTLFGTVSLMYNYTEIGYSDLFLR